MPDRQRAQGGGVGVADAMPSLARPSDMIDQVMRAKPRQNRGWNEIELRNLTEAWGRQRWPGSRVCHELVIDRGSCRLDVAFVQPDRLNIVEIKSAYDTMERAIHQCGMARAAGHEAWIVTDARHDKDLRLLHFLLPSVGIACAPMVRDSHVTDAAKIEIIAEAAPGQPYPEVMASLLWVAELLSALGYGPMPRPPSHARLAQVLAQHPINEVARLVCRELRGRNAQWRADPPIAVQPANHA